MSREFPGNQAIAGRLKLKDDGSISNANVEMFAMLLAEDVVGPTAAPIIIWKTKLSGLYLAEIRRNQVFKDRVKTLTEERQALEGDGLHGQIEWQGRQIYRKGAALDDARLMVQGTNILLDLAKLKQRQAGAKPDESEAEEGEVRRGPGAPAAPGPPEANYRAEGMRAQLAQR